MKRIYFKELRWYDQYGEDKWPIYGETLEECWIDCQDTLELFTTLMSLQNDSSCFNVRVIEV